MKNKSRTYSKATERPKNPKKSKSSSQSSNSNAETKMLNIDKILEQKNLSPFLVAIDDLPNLPSKASFVEYLRWMRAFKPETSDQNKAENNATKLHLLQIAQDDSHADYFQYLKRTNDRTKRIVAIKQGEEITVTCPWRIRVGGHRGPESILLPAFDGLGIPFIPSSTLRGIARTQAIREEMTKNNLTWRQAEQHETIIEHFGSLETKDKNKREGKVTFLDAYPVADKSPSGGLTLDIANNIWKWDANNLPDYQPNPNLFLSLKQPTFLIGIIPNHHGNNTHLDKVKQWLLQGLAIGAGSQINSGYGCLTERDNYEVNKNKEKILLEVEFTLKGQLINGYKSYQEKPLSQPYKINNETGEFKINSSTLNNPEVRPIAFKSMLRYWFRVIALGVLPKTRVKELESFIFGGIEPKHRGLIQVQIHNSDDGKSPTQTNYGKQSGKLVILASSELLEDNYQLLTHFIEALTWIMFHLGGIGLGARRPLHQRPSNPYWRGIDLNIGETDLNPESKDKFWQTPDTIQDFKKKFNTSFEGFYKKLEEIQIYYIEVMKKLKPSVHYETYSINSQSPREAEKLPQHSWVDAIDKHCRILIYPKSTNNQNNYQQKSDALSLLHSCCLNKEDLNKQGKNRFLCGEDGVCSPVIIASHTHYEVITIFNASFQENPKKNPRHKYFEKLYPKGVNTRAVSILFG